MVLVGRLLPVFWLSGFFFCSTAPGADLVSTQDIESARKQQLQQIGITPQEFSEQQQANTDSPKTFLINRRDALYGIPMLAVNESQLQDYGVDQVEGDPYWDSYGTGALYVGPGGDNLLGGQLWYVNFASRARTRLTDGVCITGIGNILPTWRCTYNTPVAADSGNLAFIQQVSAAPDGPPEGVNDQIVISTGGSAFGAVGMDSRPDHLDWSPDGEWLLFADGKEMVAVSIGGKICTLTGFETTVVRHPEWGGDTQEAIVYSAGGNLWLVPVKTQHRADRCPELQVKEKVQLTDTEYHDDRPQWINNGLVAFVSDRPIDANDITRRKRMWAVNAGTLAASVVVDMPFNIDHTDWQSSSGTPKESRIKDAAGKMR